MRIVLPGVPIPKNRPRCWCLKNKPQLYDDQAKQAAAVRHQIRQALECVFASGPEMALELHRIAQAESLRVDWYFHMPVARSDPTGARNAKLWNLSPAAIKPDVDNLIKFYADCANGIVWKDDCMIVEGYYKKVFSETPRTEIEIVSNNDDMFTQQEIKIMRLISPEQLKEFLHDAERFKELGLFPVEEMDQEIKESFLRKSTLLLIEFANKYADTLKKIQRISQQDACVGHNGPLC